MKKVISHFYKILDYLSNLILVVLFAALVLLLFLEVFGRFFLSFSFMWTEEVARYLFIWVTFIGAGVVFSKGGHLAVDVLLNKFPIKVKYVIGIVFYVLMIAFLLLTIYTGFQYSALNYSKPLYSTYVTSLGVVYLAVPIGGIIMVLNIIRELYKMYILGIEYYNLKEGGVLMIIMFIAFAVLLASGLPAAFAMGASGLIGILSIENASLIVVPQKIFLSLNSFPLLAVPLFVLTGEIMNTGGITKRIVTFSNALLRHWRGALSHVNILTSMIMAGFSGSATADAVSVGAILIPAMVEDGYTPEFAAGVTAASACIGPIIPPSIIMVLYGGITGISIGKLFLAGIIPGILIGLSQMLITVYYGYKYNWPRKPRASKKEVLSSTKDAIWALFAPVIILGSILSGVCTATEAAALAVVYCLFISIVISKELKISDLPKVLRKAALSTAIPCLIISYASLFGYVITRENFAKVIVNMFFSISTNPPIVMLLVIAMLMLIGLFIDGTVALITFTPILYPIGQQMGFDPIHFAIIILIVIMIGTITPPVGLQLYVASSIAKVSVSKTVIWPFVAAMLVVVFLCAYIPILVTFVPTLVFR